MPMKSYPGGGNKGTQGGSGEQIRFTDSSEFYGQVYMTLGMRCKFN